MQGFADGQISIQSLVGAISGMSSPRVLQSHKSKVKCMMAYSFERYNREERFVKGTILISGAQDGSISAFILPGGEAFFDLHLQAAPVCTFSFYFVFSFLQSLYV